MGGTPEHGRSIIAHGQLLCNPSRSPHVFLGEQSRDIDAFLLYLQNILFPSCGPLELSERRGKAATRINWLRYSFQEEFFSIKPGLRSCLILLPLWAHPHSPELYVDGQMSGCIITVLAAFSDWTEEHSAAPQINIYRALFTCYTIYIKRYF